jgi:hypothetical protein
MLIFILIKGALLIAPVLERPKQDISRTLVLHGHSGSWTAGMTLMMEAFHSVDASHRHTQIHLACKKKKFSQKEKE